MEQQRRLPDLIINGVSSASGGQYDTVSIDGVGKVEGDLLSRTFKANGHIKVNGSMRTDSVNCDGKLAVAGNLQAAEIVVNGLNSIAGSVSADRLLLNGWLTVKGECEIERFEAEGGFEVAGLLSAGTLDVRLQGRCAAKEIGVESVRVRRSAKRVWNTVWRWLFPKLVPELRAGTIEGDDIDLEYTSADVVRGNKIVIGKGCSIGRVEYRSELTVLSGAKVDTEVKAGA